MSGGQSTPLFKGETAMVDKTAKLVKGKDGAGFLWSLSE